MVFKGINYIVTAHWIDDNWAPKIIYLDFLRFDTPQTEESMYAPLFNAIYSWDLLQKVRTVAKDNSTDKCNGLSKLTGNIYSEGYFSSNLDYIMFDALLIWL